jgi:hypothetical protein
MLNGWCCRQRRAHGDWDRPLAACQTRERGGRRWRWCADDADDATDIDNERPAIGHGTKFCRVDANIEIIAGFVLSGAVRRWSDLSLSHQNGPLAGGQCSNGPSSSLPHRSQGRHRAMCRSADGCVRGRSPTAAVQTMEPASKARQSASLSVRWPLARKPDMTVSVAHDMSGDTGLF